MKKQDKLEREETIRSIIKTRKEEFGVKFRWYSKIFEIPEASFSRFIHNKRKEGTGGLSAKRLIMMEEYFDIKR